MSLHHPTLHSGSWYHQDPQRQRPDPSWAPPAAWAWGAASALPPTWAAPARNENPDHLMDGEIRVSISSKGFRVLYTSQAVTFPPPSPCGSTSAAKQVLPSPESSVTSSETSAPEFPACGAPNQSTPSIIAASLLPWHSCWRIAARVEHPADWASMLVRSTPLEHLEITKKQLLR